jgi:hypothetical protein
MGEAATRVLSEVYGTAQRSQLLKAALHYAEQGWPVFPCEPGGKRPLIKDWPNRASTDPHKIHLWWNHWPNANIAIPTGKRSGLLVLDVDHPPSLDDLEDERGELPKTRTHSTGNGGIHLIFVYPAGDQISNSAGKLGPGLDVRGQGGYIVVPPSRTTRPYEHLDEADIADAPAWFLEGLREPQKPPSGTAGAPTRAPVYLERAGEVIADGTRNTTLTSIAGRLHDGTRDLEQLTANLLAIRDERCENPETYTDAEVAAIACWLQSKPPCRPGRSRGQEVEEVLEAAGRYWYDMLLPGGGRSKLRDVFRTHLGHGGRHGKLVKVWIGSEERRAVKYDASCRQLAPDAGTSPMSVSRNTKRLRELGAIRSDNAGRHEEDGGTFLIVEPAPQRYTHIKEGRNAAEPSVVEGCNTTSRPPRPDRLHTPAPRWGDHVGNAGAGALYALEAFGSQTREELARRLRYSRARDLERNHLRRLEELGLIENVDGVWGLVGAYEEATDEIRRAPYSTVRRVRRQRPSVEGLLVTEVVEVGSVASVEERDRAARESYAEESTVYRVRRLAWRRYSHEAIARKVGLSEERVREILKLADVPQPAAKKAAGEIAELERVPDAGAELVEALAAYLDRNPALRDEYPSCLAIDLWKYELVEGKPTSADVKRALAELHAVA